MAAMTSRENALYAMFSGIFYGILKPLRHFGGSKI